MSYRGHVVNGVVVLDQATLPEGTEVRVEPVPETARKTLADRLRRVIGRAEGLPVDMADQHDHYLHGTPKK